MDNQGFNLSFATDAQFLGHLVCNRKTDDQISQMLKGPRLGLGRETQNIRGLVDPTVFPVQLAHDAVIHIGNGEPSRAWRQTQPQPFEQGPQGPFARPAQLAAGRPIHLEFRNFFRHFTSPFFQAIQVNKIWQKRLICQLL
nr:hypothetical protein [uncultured Holophaga sp.]